MTILHAVTQLQTDPVTSRLNTLLEAGALEIAIKDGALQLAGKTAAEITAEFGSPLYIYSERILRRRARECRRFLQYEPFVPNYSCKANTNVALLQIVHSEGLHADAMSPGEILLLRAAGFQPNEIFYVGNYVDDAELLYAIKAGVQVSVDSLAQLERFGRLNPGGQVAVRINPGMGDGHHKKVVTGGAESKFGIWYEDVSKIKEITARYNLRIAGINQHIGSNYLTGDVYLQTVARLLSIAEQFADLDFVDFGGGMGIPYKNNTGRLDLVELGGRVSDMLESWTARYGKRITAQIEPGRYVVAESGLLLITVQALKENPGLSFVGTDGGFNVLARPVMYGSHHEIINTRNVDNTNGKTVTICGNICESGDKLAEDRQLAATAQGDVLAVLDAGAYGFSMASNYNSRLRPAEVLITQENSLRLVRERGTLEDLLRHQIY